MSGRKTCGRCRTKRLRRPCARWIASLHGRLGGGAFVYILSLAACVASWYPNPARRFESVTENPHTSGVRQTRTPTSSFRQPGSETDGDIKAAEKRKGRQNKFPIRPAQGRRPTSVSSMGASGVYTLCTPSLPCPPPTQSKTHRYAERRKRGQPVPQADPLQLLGQSSRIEIAFHLFPVPPFQP